jgi:hypothetical protein
MPVLTEAAEAVKVSFPAMAEFGDEGNITAGFWRWQGAWPSTRMCVTEEGRKPRPI